MGIIKRADLESFTRDAVPMDLGDLHNRGVTVIQMAQEQAAQILHDAAAKREQLLGDAEETGSAKGYEAGLKQGNEVGTAQGIERATTDHAQRLENLENNWSGALLAWESDRVDLMIAARTEIIQLAAHIAGRVIKRTIDLDPEIVVDQLDSILETLVTPTDIKIRVHPGDLELLGRVMPKMIDQCSACKHADLAGDDTLAPGSCVVSTIGGGTVDASIQTQLDRVVATLLPAHRGPKYDHHLEDSVSDQSSADDAA